MCIRDREVSEHFRGSNFKVFARMLETKGNEVWAVPAKGAGQRTFCDRMNSWAQSEGQPGLGYIFWRETDGKTEGAGPIANNIGPERAEAVREQLGLAAGDAAFFVAGDPVSYTHLDVYKRQASRRRWHNPSAHPTADDATNR